MSSRFTIDNERHALLAPYLQQVFDTYTESEAPPQEPHADRWEIEIIREVAGSEREKRDPWTELIVEGTAWQLKFGEEVARLSAGTGEVSTRTLDAINAQLMTDAAIGIALMKETQSVIDGMVLSGHFDLAKRVSNFRNRMGQTLNRIEQEIGSSAFAAAETMAEAMTAPEPRLKPTPAVVDDAPARRIAAKHAVKRRRRVAEDRAENREADLEVDRMPQLLLTLGALMLIWGIFFMPRLFHDEIPVLTADQLPQSAVIVEMTPRAPSMFFAVSTDEWWATSRSDRETLLREIGDTLGSYGYTGAQFVAADGTTVGRWLSSSGVWLAPRTRPGSTVRS